MYVGSKPWRHIPGEVGNFQVSAQEAKNAISFYCNIVDVGVKFKIGSKC